jgi:hypothetical protein
MNHSAELSEAARSLLLFCCGIPALLVTVGTLGYIFTGKWWLARKVNPITGLGDQLPFGADPAKNGQASGDPPPQA